MLNMVQTEPAAAVNDTGTYFRLDEALEPVACNRLEWDAFQKSGAATAHRSCVDELKALLKRLRREREPLLALQ